MLLGQARGELDFYPRPPGGGRLAVLSIIMIGSGISIPALRVEGDVTRKATSRRCLISIHALRVEGDAVRVYTVSVTK